MSFEKGGSFGREENSIHPLFTQWQGKEHGRVCLKARAQLERDRETRRACQEKKVGMKGRARFPNFFLSAQVWQRGNYKLFPCLSVCLGHPRPEMRALRRRLPHPPVPEGPRATHPRTQAAAAREGAAERRGGQEAAAPARAEEEEGGRWRGSDARQRRHSRGRPAQHPTAAAATTAAATATATATATTAARGWRGRCLDSSGASHTARGTVPRPARRCSRFEKTP